MTIALHTESTFPAGYVEPVSVYPLSPLVLVTTLGGTNPLFAPILFNLEGCDWLTIYSRGVAGQPGATFFFDVLLRYFAQDDATPLAEINIRAGAGSYVSVAASSTSHNAAEWYPGNAGGAGQWKGAVWKCLALGIERTGQTGGFLDGTVSIVVYGRKGRRDRST